MEKNTMLKMIFIVSILLLSMIVHEIVKSYTISQKLIKTNATPITNKIIVLDAGHGLPDERSSRFYWDNRASNKS